MFSVGQIPLSTSIRELITANKCQPEHSGGRTGGRTHDLAVGFRCEYMQRETTATPVVQGVDSSRANEHQKTSRKMKKLGLSCN